jgi:hypothetical protein
MKFEDPIQITRNLKSPPNISKTLTLENQGKITVWRDIFGGLFQKVFIIFSLFGLDFQIYLRLISYYFKFIYAYKFQNACILL